MHADRLQVGKSRKYSSENILIDRGYNSHAFKRKIYLAWDIWYRVISTYKIYAPVILDFKTNRLFFGFLFFVFRSAGTARFLLIDFLLWSGTRRRLFDFSFLRIVDFLVFRRWRRNSGLLKSRFREVWQVILICLLYLTRNKLIFLNSHAILE